MMRRTTTMLALLGAIGLLASGCGGDPLDGEADEIANWANAASALGAFVPIYEPLSFADGNTTFDDPACPATTDDGTTVTITGDDCEASDGDVYHGSATVVRNGADRSLTLDGYGINDDALVTGTGEITNVAMDVNDFTVDVVSDGAVVRTVMYSGTVEGGYSGPTTWNGSGAVERRGFTESPGIVTATTVDQLRDNSICPRRGNLRHHHPGQRRAHRGHHLRRRIGLRQTTTRRPGAGTEKTRAWPRESCCSVASPGRSHGDDMAVPWLPLAVFGALFILSRRRRR